MTQFSKTYSKNHKSQFKKNIVNSNYFQNSQNLMSNLSKVKKRQFIYKIKKFLKDNHKIQKINKERFSQKNRYSLTIRIKTL